MSTIDSSWAMDAARLRQLPMFSDTGNDELARVLARSVVISRDPGSVLVAEGAPGTEVFVILSGTAEVARKGEVLTQLGPGDLFGEMAAFDAGVRTATVTATSAIELLLIDPRGVAELVPPGSLAEKMLHTLSERLRLTQDLPDWSATITEAAAYTLGAAASERDRLVAQALALKPIAEWLLDRLPVVQGDRVVDVACGPVGILDLLGERVGSAGSVCGLDREPRMIEMARELAAQRAQTVELVVGDAAAPELRHADYDVVHARFLLINIVNVQEILAEMTRLARPGGVVAVQEPDCAYWVCDPPHPAWDRLLDVAFTTWRVQGRDAGIGRTLGRRLRRAGLEDVSTQCHVIRTKAGDTLQKNLLGVVSAAKPLIIESGVYDEAGVDQLVGSLQGHLDHPDTTTAWAVWQAWGRRPSTG